MIPIDRKHERVANTPSLPPVNPDGESLSAGTSLGESRLFIPEPHSPHVLSRLSLPVQPRERDVIGNAADVLLVD